MAEKINIPDEVTHKEDLYLALIPQINALVEGETDLIANLSNVVAAIKETFNFFWIGFYFVKKEHLVLGPFQGPVACTRINYGKGVCGTSWKKKKTIIVDDVDKFPGHIACSSFSKSEIVIPIIKNSEVIAVLDIDSQYLNHFDEIDEKYLSIILSYINF